MIHIFSNFWKSKVYILKICLFSISYNHFFKFFNNLILNWRHVDLWLESNDNHKYKMLMHIVLYFVRPSSTWYVKHHKVINIVWFKYKKSWRGHNKTSLVWPDLAIFRQIWQQFFCPKIGTFFCDFWVWLKNKYSYIFLFYFFI